MPGGGLVSACKRHRATPCRIEARKAAGHDQRQVRYVTAAELVERLGLASHHPLDNWSRFLPGATAHPGKTLP